MWRASPLLLAACATACTGTTPPLSDAGPDDVAPRPDVLDRDVPRPDDGPDLPGIDASPAGCTTLPPGAPPEIRPLRVMPGVTCVRYPHALVGPRDAIEVADGTVFVSEMGAGRIARFAGGTWSPYVDGLVAPIGLRALADGSLVVAEEHAHRLSRVRNGVRETVAEDLGNVTYLTLDAQERVYVSSFTAFAPTGTLWQIALTPGAAPRAFATGLNVPEALRFDPDGTLLAAEWNAPSRILRFAPTGGPATAAQTVAAGFSGVYGLARLASGALLVAHHNRDVAAHGEVVRIAPDGTRTVVLGDIKTPGGITVTPGGDVLVTEFHGGGSVGYLIRLSGL